MDNVHGTTPRDEKKGYFGKFFPAVKIFSLIKEVLGETTDRLL